MSGSMPTNNQAVQFEEQQAAQAQQQDAARQARLQQGQTLIDQIFNGQPVMQTTTSPYDWSSFKQPTTVGAAYGATSQPSGVPSGYTAVQVPSRGGTAGATGAAAAPPQYEVTPGAGGRGVSQVAQVGGGGGIGGAAGGGTTWALKDASGKIYYPGDPLTVTTQTPTGQTTGGFDSNFYNNYNQQILNYYNPEEAKQYAEAQRNLTYNLARAGTLNSSYAADAAGNLAYNDALNKASIVANANQQTGQLQDQILANKQSMINELYSTEDPTLTANLAQASANASALKTPLLTPNASFFAPALSAAGAAGQALTYPGPFGTVFPVGGSGAQYVQPTGGTVASSSASSGQTFQG